MAYPNFYTDRELFKIKTKDVYIKELKSETEKHHHEKILKPLKVGNEIYKKKYKSLNKKKVFIIITEILNGSASTINSGIISILNSGVGVIIQVAQLY